MKQHKALLKQLIRRDISTRYRGTLLGRCWTVLHPLLLLAVYTFVFGVVFKARWNTQLADGGTVSFAILLYSGLIYHAFLAEVLGRSTSIILQHRNYVTKVVFPLWLLPVMVVLTALFMYVIQLGVLVAVMLILGHAIPVTALLLPLVIAPLALMALGTAWFLASMGVYMRDLSQIIGLVIMALLFLSPIFYPLSALPEAYQSIVLLNPLTLIIENGRAVLLHGQMPAWDMIGIYSVISAIWCRFGYWWFVRTRKGFNDVL